MNTIQQIPGKRPLSLLSIALAVTLFGAAMMEATDSSARRINKRSDAPVTILYNGKITTLDATNSTV